MTPVCIRCGKPERYGEAWICRACFDDPQRLIEQRAVESASWGDFREMRRALKQRYGWYGWGRKETETASD